MEVAPIGVMASRGADVATLYVQASRGVQDYTLVTDDQRLLVQRLGQETGMNLIASDELGETDRPNDKEAERDERVAPEAPDRSEEPDLPNDGALWAIDDAPDDISQRRAPLQKRIEHDLPVSFPDHTL